MNYISTRGGSQPISSAEAIIKGIADDGGLFVPEEIPQIPRNFINNMIKADYELRAENVLGLYLTDFDETDIATCVMRAYGDGKFDSSYRVQLKLIGNYESFNVLELWHGPTSAFKDMALQLLPHLLNKSLKKMNEKHEIMILVATSGDTGKAALAGFANVKHVKIFVFYPAGGVSQIQRLQMVTQLGKNVEVIGVHGNFDDTQNGVKEIFNDREFNAKIESLGFKLSSANSINWGRLVPQIVYYFSAYADLLARQKIQAGEKINFCVPTGNFGDILAAYYAKKMGLPINRLICASNQNDVLTEFFKTGRYNRKREFFKTVSPSMDILISSNLERLLYHETQDSERVKKYMSDLSENGEYDIGSELLEQLNSIFWAEFASEDETFATIKKVFDEHQYLIDTHTAVAWNVAEKYQAATNDKSEMVVVSTASPYKFASSVLKSLGRYMNDMSEFTMIDRLHEISHMQIPQNFIELKNARELHTKICDKNEMKNLVEKFAVSENS